MRHTADVLSPGPWLLASDEQLPAGGSPPETPAEAALPCWARHVTKGLVSKNGLVSHLAEQPRAWGR